MQPIGRTSETFFKQYKLYFHMDLMTLTLTALGAAESRGTGPLHWPPRVACLGEFMHRIHMQAHDLLRALLAVIEQG